MCSVEPDRADGGLRAARRKNRATLNPLRGHPHFKAYLALISVCFFWGTTYLGIRVALESIPPLALVALVDPSSGRMAEELHQLQDVIRTDATPGEAVVVMILQPSYGQIYVVQARPFIPGT